MNYITDCESQKLLERFIQYVKVWTTSDSDAADNGNQPSTERQFDLAHILESQLKNFGFENVQVTDHCYVYGLLPPSPSKKNVPPFALLAHMDTVEECSGKDIQPVITQKDGDTIISTDGTTLLGADDKAGIAAIMSACAYLIEHPELEHGPIEVIFSPDEETGHGMDNVPLNLIKSKYAYTVDGGSLGELETECFNAFKSEITFTGKSTHTGTARAEKMVNAFTMMANFIANLPRHQSPETTDGYQGFFAPMGGEGTCEKAFCTVFLRDFTKEGMESRKEFINSLAHTTAMASGGQVEVKHTEQYVNMKEKLSLNRSVVENLKMAYNKSNVPVIEVPIRGGTDGSRLTELGIPTPNIFTGGHNFHSREEWASLNEMCRAADVLINLAQINAQ